MLGVRNDIKLCSYDGKSKRSSDVAKLLPGRLLADYDVGEAHDAHLARTRKV